MGLDVLYYQHKFKNLSTIEPLRFTQASRMQNDHVLMYYFDVRLWIFLSTPISVTYLAPRIQYNNISR